MRNRQDVARVGIYAGAFNPVHAGHISFALQAVEQTGLDRLYFLPERQPRSQQGVEHFGHRVAMLKRAIKPHPKFDVLELPDISFSMERTLPRLQQALPGRQLVFIFGSDVVEQMGDWPGAERLLKTSELIVGMRGVDDEKQVRGQLKKLPARPQALHVLTPQAPKVSSRKVRNALRKREYVQGLLKSVQRYSDKNWLYVSLA